MFISPRCLALPLLVALASAGASAPDSDALEKNRQRLQAWRADPEQYSRLMRDLREFYSLPAARQQQLRNLDARLHSGDLATQARLWAALERYTNWLGRQPEEVRREVLASPRDARLALIRKLRDQEYVATLPQKSRAELERFQGEDRSRQISKLRAAERRGRPRVRP